MYFLFSINRHPFSQQLCPLPEYLYQLDICTHTPAQRGSCRSRLNKLQHGYVRYPCVHICNVRNEIFASILTDKSKLIFPPTIIPSNESIPLPVYLNTVLTCPIVVRLPRMPGLVSPGGSVTPPPS